MQSEWMKEKSIVAALCLQTSIHSYRYRSPILHVGWNTLTHWTRNSQTLVTRWGCGRQFHVPRHTSTEDPRLVLQDVRNNPPAGNWYCLEDKDGHAKYWFELHVSSVHSLHLIDENISIFFLKHFLVYSIFSHLPKTFAQLFTCHFQCQLLRWRCLISALRKRRVWSFL